MPKGYPKNGMNKGWFTKDQKAHLGFKHSIESKAKMALYRKGKPNTNKGGYKLSSETRLKISLGHKGEKSYRWITDRTKLVKRQERNDMAYKDWRRQVWSRDNWKCKIANQDCNGRIEAHHILGWTSYPELRYEINNGITLCHAHHPRKRIEEQRLIPIFQELLKV